MKVVAKLYEQFRPENYQLELTPDKKSKNYNIRLLIKGRKIGRPSKRITLHQKGLKIIAAKLIRNDKRGATELEVSRINHLPTVDEVRIHSKEMLYPGSYEVILNYKLDSKKIEALKKSIHETGRRSLLPSIDEPEAWASAKLEIKR